MKPKIIKTEKDYAAALVRIAELMDARRNTPAGEELDRLSTLVHTYEDESVTFTRNHYDFGKMKGERNPYLKRRVANSTKSTIRFSAKLVRPEAIEKSGAGAELTLPKNTSAKLPSRGLTTVEGTINGFPFRAALKPNGHGSHSLRVDKVLQKAAGVSTDDTVTVEITRVGDEPEVRLPKELRQALAAAPRAQALWVAITPLARRDWILWITSAKHGKTRLHRIETACDMLASGKRRVCCFGGLNWLTKDHAPAGGTWVPLPNVKNCPTTGPAK